MPFYRKISLFICTIFILQSCNSLETNTQQTPTKENDYFSFSGKILNNTQEEIELWTFSKDNITVKINSDGTFSGRLKISEPMGETLVINYGKILLQFDIYARNGYNLHFAWDTKDLDLDSQIKGKGIFKAMKITGFGSDIVNYKHSFDVAEREAGDHPSLNVTMSKPELKRTIENINAQKLNGVPKTDPIFTAYLTDQLNYEVEYWFEKKDNEEAFRKALAKGMLSPKFTDYENYNGSKTSLDDFKGKYVYIDVWAVWCKPCIAEFPYLKKLEEKYHNKNIVFLSISVDEQDNKEEWKEMVTEEELEGVQLIADNETESDFMKAYMVGGIPRFILIDPKGYIVNAKAPRPSDTEEIESLFSQLNL